MFQFIGQEPRIEAVRVGVKKGTDSVRPVKVTVSSSAIVDQIVDQIGSLGSNTRN